MNEPRVKLRHRAEAGLVWLLIFLLRPLSPSAASRLGAAVAGALGPLIPTSRVADKNLRLAMPALNEAERRDIVRECWQNLGATAAELVHLGAIKEIPLDAAGPGYTVTGWDEYAAASVVLDKPAIIFTGHIGNWEILPASAFGRGLNVAFMYRAASNPLVDAMLTALRDANSQRHVPMFPKGQAGARAAYAHLLKGGQLGLLVDQKLDTGLSVPFFGHPAQTMDALASFALKFRCPVIPAHVERVAPARLHVVCEAPLALPNTGDKQEDLRALTLAMNQTLERWITAKPGAWLWLHRRWPKEIYRQLS